MERIIDEILETSAGDMEYVKEIIKKLKDKIELNADYAIGTVDLKDFYAENYEMYVNIFNGFYEEDPIGFRKFVIYEIHRDFTINQLQELLLPNYEEENQKDILKELGYEEELIEEAFSEEEEEEKEEE